MMHLMCIRLHLGQHLRSKSITTASPAQESDWRELDLPSETQTAAH